MKLDTLYPYVAVSILFHSILILSFYLFIKITGLLFSGKFPEINIKSSVRVDVVAMPDLSLQELKSVGFSNKGWKEKFAKEVDDPAVKKIFKKAKNNFQSMLKGISSQKVKSKISKKSTKKKMDNKKLKKLVLKGNQLSKSNRITGEGIGDLSGKFDLYISNLPEKIKPYWKLPSHLMGQELQCRIRIFLAPNGRLLKVELLKGSGNKEYDDRALASIKTAAPFDNVPEEIRKRVLRGDIVLGFPL
ncbi:MAG: cell envelope integrity protein TolA [Halobacteriovoraceae bacterium]|nr:cell envelope integrity protein TolA [Halobacteriovoraceae bacterium]